MEKRTSSVLQLNIKTTPNATTVITGHCNLGNMAIRYELQANYICKNYEDKEEPESLKHIFCMGAKLFKGLDEIGRAESLHIWNFIRESGWIFDH